MQQKMEERINDVRESNREKSVEAAQPTELVVSGDYSSEVETTEHAGVTDSAVVVEISTLGVHKSALLAPKNPYSINNVAALAQPDAATGF